MITTVPILDVETEGKPAVASFAEAVATVQGRIDAFDGAPWCAIEGEWHSRARSTVVEILGGGWSYIIRRDGEISRDVIRACIESQQRPARGSG